MNLIKTHPFRPTLWAQALANLIYTCSSYHESIIIILTIIMYYFSSGVHIQLQKTLLSPEQQDLKPDQQFLELLAGEVGSKWLFLASALSLTSSEVEVVKKKHCHLDHALRMLQKWVEREDATYGQLCHKLKSIPLFQLWH